MIVPLLDQDADVGDGEEGQHGGGGARSLEMVVDAGEPEALHD